MAIHTNYLAYLSTNIMLRCSIFWPVGGAGTSPPNHRRVLHWSALDVDIGAVYYAWCAICRSRTATSGDDRAKLSYWQVVCGIPITKNIAEQCVQSGSKTLQNLQQLQVIYFRQKQLYESSPKQFNRTNNSAANNSRPTVRPWLRVK